MVIANSGVFLFFVSKQTMLIAIVIDRSYTPQLQPGFRVSFRVELHQLNPVGGHKGDEGDEVLFGHGVMNGDKVFIFHIFDGEQVVIVCHFCFQRGKGNAAAADQSASGAVDDVAADRADIKLTPQHIAGWIPVDNMLSVHQLDHRNPQCLGQGLQKADVRQTFGSFPFGNGLAADADFFCQL